MGLKIFVSAMNLHTRRLPMAVSSGLNGSQSATKPSALSTSVRLTWSHSATKPSAPSASERFTTPRKATKPLAPSACARVTWSRSATKPVAPSISVRLTWSHSATHGRSRTVRPRSRPSTWPWDAKGRQYHSHPDEDAVKNAAPKRSWNPFPNMSSRTEESSLRKNVGNKTSHF